MRGVRLFAGIALILLVSRAALATPAFSGESGLITVPTTEVLSPWAPSAGLHLYGPLGDSNGSSDIELWETQLSLGVGLLPGLEVSAALPYVQFERDVPNRRHTDGIGGIRLGTKYRLLDERDESWLSLALLGAVVFGSGRESFPAILDRNSSWGRKETYELNLIADKVLWTTPVEDQVILTLNAGVLFFEEPDSFSRHNQSAQFQRRFDSHEASFEVPFEFAAAVKIPAYTTDHFEINALEELRGNTGTIEEVDGSLPLWFLTGVRLAASNGLALQGGIDFGLSGFLEPFRFVLSLSYAMPAHATIDHAAQPQPETEAETHQPQAAAPLPAATKRKLILRGVNFDSGSDAIRLDSQVILHETSEILHHNPDISIVVIGHTDSQGAEDYNRRLSLRRAVSVRDQLITLGVSAGRMEIRGRGEVEPIASNETDSGRAENRRVELLVQ